MYNLTQILIPVYSGDFDISDKQGIALLIGIDILCFATFIILSLIWLLHKRREYSYGYDDSYSDYVFTGTFVGVLNTWTFMFVNGVALFIWFVEWIYKKL